MAFDVVVIGDTFIETNIEAVSIPNTNDYSITGISERMGGNAIDIGVICSHFGLKSALISSLGMDSSGVLNIFEKSKIDYSHVVISETKTGKKININVPGNKSSFTFEGANKHILSYGIDNNFLNSAKMVHICPIKAGNIEKLTVRLRNPIVSLQLDRSYPTSILNTNVNILISDIKEARYITKEADMESAAQKLHELGPVSVLINDNGKRIAVCKSDEYYEIDFDREVSYDASNFFESFIAGFISRFVKTSNVKTSVSFGLAYQYYAYMENNKILFKDNEEIEDLMYKILRSKNE